MPVSMSTTTESSFTLRRHSTYPSTCHPHIRPTLHNAPQCHAPSSERLCITDEASPFALRSTRNHPRTAVRRGAAWTEERHQVAAWSLPWLRVGGAGSVAIAEPALVCQAAAPAPHQGARRVPAGRLRGRGDRGCPTAFRAVRPFPCPHRFRFAMACRVEGTVSGRTRRGRWC